MMGAAPIGYRVTFARLSTLWRSTHDKTLPIYVAFQFYSFSDKRLTNFGGARNRSSVLCTALNRSRMHRPGAQLIELLKCVLNVQALDVIVSNQPGAP